MPTKKVIKKRIRNIKALVSEGKELDFHMKEMKQRMDKIKKLIRQHAAFTNKNLIDGAYGTCVFIEHTKTNTIDPDEYFQWAADNNRIDDFMNSVKVQIASARTILGDEFEGMAKTEENKWNRVTFGETITEDDEDK